MLKKINRLLKIIGLNLVHAKNPKRAGYRSHVRFEDAKTDAKCIPSPTCCVNEYNAKPAPGCVINEAYQTHDCTGGHQPTACEIKASQPASDNNITGPTS